MVDPKWPLTPSSSFKHEHFEVSVTVGCNNADDAAAFLSAVQEVIATKGRAMFPPSTSPLPCLGCGEGPK